jgi:surface protein
LVLLDGQFWDAKTFNGDLSSWSVGNVRDMSFMLAAPSYVGGDLSRWDTGRVEKMWGMFKKATSFKSDGLWTWDVSNVRDFGRAFSGCYAMDADLSAWNTSRAVFMDDMFLEAISFTSDLSSWDTRRVEDMSYMVRCAVVLDTVSLTVVVKCTAVESN